MHTAQQKLKAVVSVYLGQKSVTTVCADYQIARQTWYRWEKQFRGAIGTIWGGLKRP